VSKSRWEHEFQEIDMKLITVAIAAVITAIGTSGALAFVDPATITAGIAIGKEVVAVGQNVINFSRDKSGIFVTSGSISMAAVPPEVGSDWRQFTGAGDPVTRSYEVVIKDMLQPVGRVKFTISGDPCVQYNGEGEYLKNVGVIVDKAQVKEGHDMRVDFDVPSDGIINVERTKGAPPIASMLLRVNVSLKHIMGGVDVRQYWFVIRGSGVIFRVRDRRDAKAVVPPLDLCKKGLITQTQREESPEYVKFMKEAIWGSEYRLK